MQSRYVVCASTHIYPLTHIRLRTWGNKKTYVHTSYKQIYIYIIWPLLFFFILAWFSCLPFFCFLFRTIATIHVYKNPLTTIISSQQLVVTFYTYFVGIWMKFIRHEVLDMYICNMHVHNNFLLQPQKRQMIWIKSTFSVWE